MFKISVDPTMMVIEAFKLPKPSMEARNGQLLRWSPDNKPNSSFNFTNQRFIKGGRVSSWGILSFDTQPDNQNWEWQKCFKESLQRRARDLGMEWPNKDPTCERKATIGARNCSDKQRQQMVKQDVQTLLGGERLDLIICFMKSKMNPEYAAVKVECEIVHGVPVQVVLTKTDTSKLNMMLGNFLLKVNLKCGGINFKVSQRDVTRGKVVV